MQLGQINNHFAIPLSTAFIKGTFHPNAKQICAGQSVLIVNEAESKVYKTPLTASAKSAFMLCFFMCENTKEVP